jgi:hypothetical protein
MAELPPPTVVSLMVCDQIITDRLTGKQSIIGIFSRVHALKYPVIHPLLSVFVGLTNGHGRVELTTRIVDSNEARPPVVEGRGGVQFRNPRDIAYLALQFHGLRFPAAGEYRVQLWAGSTLLREARLDLVLATQQPRPGTPPSEFPEHPYPGPDFPSAPNDPQG